MTNETSIETAKRFGFELPEKIADYKTVIYPWLIDLGKRLKEQKLAKVDIPKSLSLVAEGLFLCGLKLMYENEMKTKALGVIMRDRLLRAREENQWLSGNNSIQVSSTQQK